MSQNFLKVVWKLERAWHRKDTEILDNHVPHLENQKRSGFSRIEKAREGVIFLQCLGSSPSLTQDWCLITICTCFYTVFASFSFWFHLHLEPNSSWFFLSSSSSRLLGIWKQCHQLSPCLPGILTLYELSWHSLVRQTVLSDSCMPNMELGLWPQGVPKLASEDQSRKCHGASLVLRFP